MQIFLVEDSAAPGVSVSHVANNVFLQKKHWPHAMVKDTTTRSPLLRPVAPLFHDIPEFVAEDVARFHVWDLAVDVRVGAADGGGRHAQDDVVILFQRRLGPAGSLKGLALRGKVGRKFAAPQAGL
ncbi:MULTISPECIES: hypothetical protein [unclassified Variovorax]|uniref:hypothetical protein n=1 Tax=unclassified Variovorax TaxID=663243 RepID=UPI0033653F78